MGQPFCSIILPRFSFLKPVEPGSRKGTKHSLEKYRAQRISEGSVVLISLQSQVCVFRGGAAQRTGERLRKVPVARLAKKYSTRLTCVFVARKKEGSKLSDVWAVVCLLKNDDALMPVHHGSQGQGHHLAKLQRCGAPRVCVRRRGSDDRRRARVCVRMRRIIES